MSAKGSAKLRHRVFASLSLSSILVFAIAASALVGMSWYVYEKDAAEGLSSEALAIAERLQGRDEAQMASFCKELPLAEGVRCTLIAPDGIVLYDSGAEAAFMDNHGDRREVAEARAGGEAAVLRHSDTLGTDTLYAAAMVAGDGSVLRLAQSRVSLPSYVGRLAPLLALIAGFSLLLSLAASHFLTKRIVGPMSSMDPAHPFDGFVYDEMVPLLARIDGQHRELMEQNAQLERAVDLRREFTGNVSHEMKTPLQVISGYAELIEAGVAAPDDISRFAGLIRAESATMRALIDDMLTLSRLDEGEAGPAAVFDLSVLCRRAVGRLTAVAQAQGATVEVRIQPNILVQGQEALAEQMVYNLIDNALRHGREQGTVAVTLVRMGSEALLSVADDGPGVPPDKRERIFERFYRVDASRSRETGGTGLGLAIVKHGAVSMGGAATVGASSLGGAEFSVRLPLAAEGDAGGFTSS